MYYFIIHPFYWYYKLYKINTVKDFIIRSIKEVQIPAIFHSINKIFINSMEFHQFFQSFADGNFFQSNHNISITL